MSFHPDKCSTLPVTCKRQPYHSTYHLHSQTLQTVTSAKYLGVTIQDNLSWDTHIDNICAKVNKTLGFLHRNLKISATNLKETVYKAYRFVHLYSVGSFLRHPHQTAGGCPEAGRSLCGESIPQHFKGHRHAGPTQVAVRPSLQQQQKSCRLAMLFKILHGQVCFDRTKLQSLPARQRRGHQQQLRQIQCRTNYRQAAFLPNTIRDWNNLLP